MLLIEIHSETESIRPAILLFLQKEIQVVYPFFLQLPEKPPRLKRMAYPIKNYRGLSPNYRGEMVGECSFYKRGGQPPYNSALRRL